MSDHPYDPRGFKARCMECSKDFYIPWETMCDAGICDGCMAKKPKKAKRTREETSE
jgi:hypothetical protein